MGAYLEFGRLRNTRLTGLSGPAAVMHHVMQPPFLWRRSFYIEVEVVMKKWILILLGLLLAVVVGRFDNPEDYRFDLPQANREEVVARQQSSCAHTVAYNK